MPRLKCHLHAPIRFRGRIAAERSVNRDFQLDAGYDVPDGLHRDRFGFHTLDLVDFQAKVIDLSQKAGKLREEVGGAIGSQDVGAFDIRHAGFRFAFHKTIL